MNQSEKWSRKEEELLVASLKESLSSWQIAKNFLSMSKKDSEIKPRTQEAINRKIRRLRQLLKTELQKAPATSEEEERESPWKLLNHYRVKNGEKSTFSKTGVLTNTTRKILCLSDLHFPLVREDLLKEAIETHADADVLVLNGDILDGYAASRFEKEKELAAIDEYIPAFNFIEHCSKKFKNVVLVSGNHDVRTSVLLKKAPINQSALTIFETDLLARIANGERLNRQGRLVEKVNFSNVHYQRQESWWVQIGKTLFIHPSNRGSSKPGFTVDIWAKKFSERLPRGSFDSIVCGHTHKVSKHIVNSTLLIEQGCMADYMAYSWSPREIIHGNSMNGYAVIYQDSNGNTDFNKSTFVFCGQLLPINKQIME